MAPERPPPSPLARALKPHFVWRPTQVVRRARNRAPRGRPASGRLPWGLEIAYDPTDTIGSSIDRTGVYELAVTEAVLRLLDPAELAIDVGANIGYHTSAMAVAVGPRGRVEAFEPHPALAESLRENVHRWARSNRAAPIAVVEAALSSMGGRATLYEPHGFDANRGLATLEDGGRAASGAAFEVDSTTLDDVLGERRVGLLKLDVEGHERPVLEGARACLSTKRIRDVLFESLEGAPTAASDLLAEYGYTLLGLSEGLAGLRLVPAESPRARQRWDAPTYLATADPGRARARISKLGWRALRPIWTWRHGSQR